MNYEENLLQALRKNNAHISIKKLPNARWGRLILPGSKETFTNQNALNILCIGSWTLGFLAFEALINMMDEVNDALNLVGLVTDDPLDPDAKISLRKRFWRYYDDEQREHYEWGILHKALEQHIPCYTGEVKCEGFHDLLKEWNPDAIIVAGFGQLIDEKIIDFPPYGIYNVHPADLLHGYGAGPQPWEDMVKRKAKTTKLTIHKVSPLIDSGDVVGQSTPINIMLDDGAFCEDVRMIGEKTFVPVKPMVKELGYEILKKKETGETGNINHIDYDKIFGDSYKNMLMQPINTARRGSILPLPEWEKDYDV